MFGDLRSQHLQPRPGRHDRRLRRHRPGQSDSTGRFIGTTGQNAALIDRYAFSGDRDVARSGL
jgi:hypothetical protein